MRNAFAQEMTAMAAEDDRIVLLSADIGNRLFDPFKAKFSDRFYNCGVAEANMIGMAAGLALCGLRPVAYTITPFITSRCLEQIKIDVCYHCVPVIIVGVGSGLSYAGLGPTHHSCDEIAALRALPELIIVSPADPAEVKLALRCAYRQSKPVYMRIGKKGEPSVYASPPDFHLGAMITMAPGTDACIICTGSIIAIAQKAVLLLKDKGISLCIVNAPTIKPLDDDALHKIFNSFSVVATLEEHSVIGGFGSAIAEWMADQGNYQTRLLRFGTADAFFHEAGTQEYIRQQLNLTPEAVTRRISLALQEKSA
jgi:transketolase